MSKPNSGHFSGTTGAKKTAILVMSNLSASDIIKLRAEGLDLREHSVKSHSSTSIKKIRERVNSRTASKAEYKKLDQAKRLAKRRKAGVKAFWDYERERIINHQPTTRAWSSSQITDILNGVTPKYKGLSIQAHHTYSVMKYPHLANKSLIMYPATFYEHFKGWHGGNFKNSLPGKPIKIIKEF